MTIPRASLALLAVGLIAGCTNSMSAPLVPNGASGQAPAAAKTSARASTGQVLYVADINGQPGVGLIHVYTAGMKNPRQIRTITNGTGRPVGLWVDSKNILYAANEPNKYPASVTEFQPGASSPFFQITNFKGYPGSVAVDANQNVFVNESYSDEGWVQEFPPGSNTAERTIDTGVGGYAFGPGSMAFDAKGNLIVAESAKLKLHIVSIAPATGKVTPLNLDLDGNNITGPGMGIDRSGNMYVGSSGASTVSVFPPGHTEPSRVISPAGGYGLTWVTPHGAVYQANYSEGAVIEIAPGSNSPTYTLPCLCGTLAAAVSR
jgi:sugar lactone lactonase YvrE